MVTPANLPPEPSTRPSAAENWLTAGKWHLVTVAAWGREAFCTELDFAMEKNQETGILRVEPCIGEDFAGYVLLQVANFGLAQGTIRPLSYFQVVDRRPMKPADVQRMLGL
jgi:hypothetical protein